MKLLSRLHCGQNDKYFLLGNTGWRSLSRFTVNILVAKLAGAETYATLVLLLTAEIMVTTLLSAWLIVPMMNTTCGATAATRNAVGKYTLVRSLKWSAILGSVALLSWILIGFKELSPLLAVGALLYVSMACMLQAIRAWRTVCFASWHVFWADLLVFGLPIAAVLLAHDGNSSTALLPVLIWSSAISAAAASLLMIGKDAKALLSAGPIDSSTRDRIAAQSMPILIGSIANTAGSRAYPILLAAIAISTEVARFGAVLTLIGPMRMLGMALSGVVRPRFALYYSRGENNHVKNLMFKVCAIIMMAGSVMAVAVIFWGDPLCQVLFGDWLSNARILLLFGVWYGVAACMGSFIVTALQTQSEQGPGFTARLRTATSISALLLALLMTGPMGALGPFIAMAMTESVYLAIAYRRWAMLDNQAKTLPASITA